VSAESDHVARSEVRAIHRDQLACMRINDESATRDAFARRLNGATTVVEDRDRVARVDACPVPKRKKIEQF